MKATMTDIISPGSPENPFTNGSPAPAHVFPDDQGDAENPNPKKTFPVERTLGSIGEARAATRSRRQKWLYVKHGTEQAYGPPLMAAEDIRGFYQGYLRRPSDAPVVRSPDGSEWAVWAGEGEPDRPAFEAEMTVVERERAWALSSETSAATEPGGAASTNELRELRVAACGDGITQLTGGPFGAAAKAAQEKPKVAPPASPHELNELGLKLWKLSKDIGDLKTPEGGVSFYVDDAVKCLRKASDHLHAEASSIELAKVREALDKK